MTEASWVSAGSQRPLPPSPHTPNTELEQQFGGWRRQEVMALRPLENNLLSQSTQLQAPPPAAGTFDRSDSKVTEMIAACVTHCLADGICNMTMDSNSMTMPMSDPNAWATAMNNLGMPPIGISGQQLLPGRSILRCFMLTNREKEIEWWVEW